MYVMVYAMNSLSLSLSLSLSVGLCVRARKQRCLCFVGVYWITGRLLNEIRS